MLDWLYRFLGSMLSFFESFTGGYAFALLLYALVFKIVFLLVVGDVALKKIS